MRTISQREMRNDSGGILREVEAGAVLVVTRRGTPVAQLSPYAGARLATKPASQAVHFTLQDLVASTVSTATVLDDLRGER